MTRREAVLSALLVFAVALVVRVVFASQIVFPKPEDTAYYVGVARNLVEGHGLVSDALWSYGTPPLGFPRPAFEVWLPLPTFLAAIAMAVGGVSFAAAQWSSVLVGSLVPVLAWRLAADVAEERGLPHGRASTLALGSGLTAAVYLPLILHSALPDSTMPFAALALGACLLMTRIARDPRGARLADPRVIGLGVLIGLAALTRNEALWIGLVWAIVAWRAGEPRPCRPVPAHRGRGRRRRRGLRPVGVAGLDGVRKPAARPGGDQRPVGDRLRHLRLERPADPGPVSRGRAGPAGGDAGRGHRPQPVLRPAAAGPAALDHRAAGAAMAGPRRRPAAGPPARR